MNGKVFIDTNVFIYLYSNDEAKKRDAVISIFKQYTCATSTQMLNEFCNVFIKKYKNSIDVIKGFIGNISKTCHIKYINEQIIYIALDINKRYNYSYYDCLMIAGALESDCEILFTEDMSDGQLIEGKLKIINPFKGVE